MFGKKWPLFSLVGFKVQVDASWLLLALLVTWSLAEGIFPEYYPDLMPVTYWSMGAAGTVGLVFSIVLHELSHALVARRYGLPISGITLFIFGGVAEMSDEPRESRTEFLMAIAGPIASAGLSLVFFFLANALAALGLPDSVQGVVLYLATINMVLALFNLLPAFPLDGGRVFRAVLWYWKGDLRWATRTAAAGGDILGFALIFLGIVNIFSGYVLGGIWWALIGLFLRQAARSAYMQLLTRQIFEGQPVARYMTRDPIAAPWDISIRDFVTDYVYTHHFDLFPVMRGDRLIGCAWIRDVKAVPQPAWADHRLEEIVQPCSADNAIGSGEDALKAIAQMRRTGNSRLLVVDDGALAGVIALKDLLDLFALKVDLENLE